MDVKPECPAIVLSEEAKAAANQAVGSVTGSCTSRKAKQWNAAYYGAELSLAEKNGAVCAESGRPEHQSNPYRKGTKNHDAFKRGYQLIKQPSTACTHLGPRGYGE